VRDVRDIRDVRDSRGYHGSGGYSRGGYGGRNRGNRSGGRNYHHRGQNYGRNYNNRNRQNNANVLQSYRDFLLSQPEDITPEEAQKNYEQYKQDFHRKNSRIFREKHHEEDWFRERYHPAHEVYKMSHDRATRKSMFARNAAAFEESYKQDLVLFPFLAKPADTEGKMELEKEFVDNALTVVSLPAQCSREDLSKLFEEIIGFNCMMLSKPDSKFQRTATIMFATQEQCRSAVTKYENFQMKWGLLKLQPNKAVLSRFLPPSATGDANLVETALESALQLISKLNTSLSIETSIFTSDTFTAKPAVDQLGVAAAYLRNVHAYSYFSAQHFKTLEQAFQNEIADANGTEIELSSNWLEQSQQGAATAAGAIDSEFSVSEAEEKEDELVAKYKTEIIEENTIKKTDAKFKCKLCPKHFKGPQFVKKHIETKHTDILEQAVAKGQQERCFDNYNADEDQPHEEVEVAPTIAQGGGGGGRDGGYREGDRDRSRTDDRDSHNSGNRPVQRHTPRAPPTPVEVDGRGSISYSAVSYEDVDANNPAEEDNIVMDYGF